MVRVEQHRAGFMSPRSFSQHQLSQNLTQTPSRFGVRAFAICVFVFTFGSNGVRYLVGLPAFFVLAALIGVASVVVFARNRPQQFRWYRLPAPLYWFLILAICSIAWSSYRLESLAGAAAQITTTLVAAVLAVVLSWHELLSTLATSMRLLLGLSYAFELWVALVVRAPVLSWWVEQPEGKNLKILLWSRNLLFDGGPIQGVNANSALFGFLALTALVLFCVQLRAGLVRTSSGSCWVAVAVLTLLLTRSATVWVSLGAVIAVLLFALWGRRLEQPRRMALYLTGCVTVVMAGIITLAARGLVFGLLGKSSDLTGRTEIWQKVWHLIAEHPWLGWGWVSYWPVWVPPYRGLDQKAGIAVMSAHNALLDVWLQLGLVGVCVCAALVLLTLHRTWFRAIDQPRRDANSVLPFASSALWPLLILTALLVQSLTESRLLIESGWLTLVLLAVKTRFDIALPLPGTEPTARRWRELPLARGRADAAITLD